MKPRTRNRILSASCLVSAAVASGLLWYWGEPAPGSPPILPTLIAALFGLVSIAFIVLSSSGPGADAPGDAPAQADDWGLVPASIVLSFMIVGFTLRISSLGNYALSNDESFFVFASGHETLRETLHDMARHFHPPTNFVLLHYILKFSWNPVWIRLPAVIGGTLAICCAFALVRRMFGALAGLIAAFFVAFSPNLILLSQVCRNYAPSFPFLILSFYFLLRFLRERTDRMLCAFALFEFLAVVWHYALLLPFLGTNLVLFAALISADRPILRITKAVAAQIPVGLFFLAALTIHRPLTEGGGFARSTSYMVEEFYWDPANPLRQFFALVKYFVADSPVITSVLPASLFFLAVIAGVLMLVRAGLRWEVALCLSFLPFAYVFAFGLHLFPFGGTRHSFYAFPFLFALASASAAMAILGLRRFLTGIHRPGVTSPRLPALRPVSRLAAMLVALACSAFLWQSVRLHTDVTPYLLRQSPLFREQVPYYKSDFYKVVELPTRVEDIDRLSSGLLARSNPGEVVLVSLPTYMILRARLVPPPHSVFFNLHQANEFVWKDRRFVSHPGAGLGFMPNRLIQTVAALARDGLLADSDRAWVATVGWENWSPSLRDWTKGIFPDAVIDEGGSPNPDDSLFAVRVSRARLYSEVLFGYGRNRLAPARVLGRTTNSYLEAPTF